MAIGVKASGEALEFQILALGGQARQIRPWIGVVLAHILPELTMGLIAEEALLWGLISCMGDGSWAAFVVFVK